jgi:hypothetical protein
MIRRGEFYHFVLRESVVTLSYEGHTANERHNGQIHAEFRCNNCCACSEQPALPLVEEEAAFQERQMDLERTKMWSWVPKVAVLAETTNKLQLRSGLT